MTVCRKIKILGKREWTEIVLVAAEFRSILGCFRKRQLRSKTFNTVKRIFRFFRIVTYQLRVQKNKRPADIEVMGSGNKHDLVGIGNRLRLVECANRHRVISKKRDRARSVGVCQPQPVVTGRVTVNVIPSAIDNPAVMGNRWIPFVRLVPRESRHLSVGIKTVNRMNSKRLPGTVAAAEPASPGRHKGDSSIGKFHRIKIIVAAGCQLGYLPRCKIHFEEVKFPLLFFHEFRDIIGRIVLKPRIPKFHRLFSIGKFRQIGKRKEHASRIERKRHCRNRSRRQFSLGQVFCLKGITGGLQQINASAANSGMPIIVRKILMKHLADKTISLDKKNRFSCEKFVLENQISQFPTKREIKLTALSIG